MVSQEEIAAAGERFFLARYGTEEIPSLNTARFFSNLNKWLQSSQVKVQSNSIVWGHICWFKKVSWKWTWLYTVGLGDASRYTSSSGFRKSICPPPPTDCSTWYFVAVKWVHDGYLQVQKRQVLDVHLCVANVLERHVGLHVSVSEKQHMKYLCVFHQIEVEVQILFLLLLYLWLLLYYHKLMSIDYPR